MHIHQQQNLLDKIINKTILKDIIWTKDNESYIGLDKKYPKLKFIANASMVEVYFDDVKFAYLDLGWGNQLKYVIDKALTDYKYTKEELSICLGKSLIEAI